MSSKPPKAKEYQIPKSARVGVVAARFNGLIVEKLLTHCLARLVELGLDESRVEVHQVPGAFELPLAAKLLAEAGRVSAVICLGCVVRGDTPHFDFVAGQCARGIQQVALAQSLPVIFGVLTTDTEQQALDRADGRHGRAGARAADAAAEMIALAAKIKGSRRNKNQKK